MKKKKKKDESDAGESIQFQWANDDDDAVQLAGLDEDGREMIRASQASSHLRLLLLLLLEDSKTSNTMELPLLLVDLMVSPRKEKKGRVEEGVGLGWTQSRPSLTTEVTIL